MVRSARSIAPAILALIGVLGIQSPTLATQDALTADDREIEAYSLTLERVKQATAVNQALIKEEKNDPGLSKRMSEGDSETIEQMTRRLEKQPKVVVALKAAGMTSRDYALTVLTAFSASMMAGLKTAAAAADMPMRGAMSDNVAFVTAHPAELEAFMDSSAKLSGEEK